MNTREATMIKLQQLPESLLQQVSDFIDFLNYQCKLQISNEKPSANASEAWAKWFEGVDRLEISPSSSNNNYHQLLLEKYKQQGLEL